MRQMAAAGMQGLRSLCWCLCLCLGVSLAPSFAWAEVAHAVAHTAEPLEVITLQHRRAEQLLPQLISFVESGGMISGQDNQLFLRASARNQAEIRELVRMLDTPPRRLMIQVRQEGEDSSDASGAEVDGQLILGAGAPVVQGRADIYRREQNRQRTTSQQVQTLEGERASIMSGQSLLVPMRQIIVTPAGVVLAQHIVQYDLGTGFVAVPRLNGDQVTLEISPFDDTAGRLPGSMNMQRLVTTVSGRLGEWIALGGSDVDTQDTQREIAGHGVKLASHQRRLLLKVDELQGR